MSICMDVQMVWLVLSLGPIRFPTVPWICKSYVFGDRIRSSMASS